MNTLHNWLRELHEWLDDLERSELSIHSLVDAPTPKERVQALNHWSEVGGIMVMGYDMFVLKSFISLYNCFPKSNPILIHFLGIVFWPLVTEHAWASTKRRRNLP